jgi:hypothetical protein
VQAKASATAEVVSKVNAFTAAATIAYQFKAALNLNLTRSLAGC